MLGDKRMSVIICQRRRISIAVMSFFNKFRVAVKSPRSTKPPVAMEISGPCDMRHEIHVGWDNDGVLQGMPESWRQWMKAANIGYLNFLSVLMAIFQVNLG